MARVDCTDIVRLSQSAAIELITSTLGAYEGKIRAGEEALETGGQLWGYARRLGDDTFIHYVEHASVSVFAERTPISIADHDEELTVKRQAMSYMRPELALLGDYHSHPWRTREEVERGTLFEYSQDDARFWRKADPYWTCTDYRPLFLVMTVCRLQRVHDSRPRPLRPNVLQFDVGEFRFWLNAIVGRMDGKKRVLSPNVRSSVCIDELPLSLGGVSGDRLGDYDPAA